MTNPSIFAAFERMWQQMTIYVQQQMIDPNITFNAISIEDIDTLFGGDSK